MRRGTVDVYWDIEESVGKSYAKSEEGVWRLWRRDSIPPAIVLQGTRVMQGFSSPNDAGTTNSKKRTAGGVDAYVGTDQNRTFKHFPLLCVRVM